VSGVLSGINVVEGTLSNGECPLGHVLIKFQKYKLTGSGDTRMVGVTDNK
jgi:hypothetical protein